MWRIGYTKTGKVTIWRTDSVVVERGLMKG